MRSIQPGRREFITLIGSAAAAWPLAVRAQQPARMKRIAVVHPSEKASNITINGRPAFRGFFEELNRLGYVEGQNLVVERYSGEGRTDRYAQLARDVVSTHPDLIVIMGNLGPQFKQATTTIPIVAASGDPIVSGLVPSLARRGGNITGVSVDAGINSGANVLGFSWRRRQNTRTLVSLYLNQVGKGLKLRRSGGGWSGGYSVGRRAANQPH